MDAERRELERRHRAEGTPDTLVALARIRARDGEPDLARTIKSAHRCAIRTARLRKIQPHAVDEDGPVEILNFHNLLEASVKADLRRLARSARNVSDLGSLMACLGRQFEVAWVAEITGALNVNLIRRRQRAAARERRGDERRRRDMPVRELGELRRNGPLPAPLADMLRFHGYERSGLGGWSKPGFQYRHRVDDAFLRDLVDQHGVDAAEELERVLAARVVPVAPNASDLQHRLEAFMDACRAELRGNRLPETAIADRYRDLILVLPGVEGREIRESLESQHVEGVSVTLARVMELAGATVAAANQAAAALVHLGRRHGARPLPGR